MGLAEQQAALARLYTDAVWRERFFSSPATTGAELGLSTAETQQLAKLSSDSITFFANSLKNKRLNEAQKLLAWTNRALRDRFTVLFRLYSTSGIARGEPNHYEDAIAFVAFLANVAVTNTAEEKLEPWVIEGARYEAAWLLARRPAACLILRRFKYRVAEMRTDSPDGEAPPLSRGVTVAVWLRLSQRHRLYHRLITAPFPPLRRHMK